MQSDKISYLGSTYLVTGGAGSIGSVLVKSILENYNPASIRVFDNSDYLLAKLARELDDDRVRCILGNVYDRERLDLALQGVDYVFHLAAIKDISISEYNPLETINTNVKGTANLVECCLKARPKKVLNLSSDKAIGFQTLYGATKYITEQLFSWGHQVAYPKIAFCNVRLGNIIESRGNVFEIWNEQHKKGKPITITDTEMQRYFMHVKDAVDNILLAFELANGGELFVPQMIEYNLMDMAEQYIGVNADYSIIGIRKGEKIRENLMTEDEFDRARSVDGLWVIK